MPDHRHLDIPVPASSLTDHARAWNPPEDPGLAIDQAINRARAACGVRRDDDAVLYDRDAAADEADRHDAELERDAWNTAHPVGQPVIVARPDGTWYRGRTTSLADLLECGTPGVDVEIMGLPGGFWPLSRVEPVAELPSATAAAAESERPGVLPVAPTAPGTRTGPDALAVLCHELGLEFLALAEARRDGKSWDDGHWKRLRGAVEAAGVVLEAGPRPDREVGQP
jgi:hypothetical protein